jgi:hypothetical protein
MCADTRKIDGLLMQFELLSKFIAAEGMIIRTVALDLDAILSGVGLKLALALDGFASS